ncbi:efflux RND transporter periplasmic adaptor subunit [Sphingomonas qomolangmaensis]|uniref:HlyD family efflux transporter periplasmic adaptor subunit n=1 Tax=Sphingomonas qomolangmaensis TaxID=2918765 RepID=A0ABY5L3U0_9SPHN|nr:HlyD family efflux transporter periplasmic adaptor subunit [Sphingomonas qomolangmaensis]UUL81625.1 HlyD family efflux transporter periplasmic adaptor subunit [Sphingomonas qomolangmaensis]
MLFQPDHLAHFPTLVSIRPPRVTQVIAWMLMIGIGLVTAILFGVPWLQTSAGTGQVVALNPDDRVQSVTALVQGRVERWYVNDGDQVKAGDPIARLIDNDPDLLVRLRAERAQVAAEIAAAEQAMAVAQLDVGRSGQLLAEGLIARRDYEASQIRVADHRAKLAEARAKLSRVDVGLNRQSAQTVRAPRDGRIQTIDAGAGATLVNPGDILATLAPEAPVRVVELLVDGRDVALIYPGRPVRLAFEGWPAIQFSGWPSIAEGMFDGRVRSVDPSAQATGLFRVLVEPMPGRLSWPDDDYVRLGAKVRGWIQMETVSVGYELWRQLNDFPLEFRRPAIEAEAKAQEKAK